MISEDSRLTPSPPSGLGTTLHHVSPLPVPPLIKPDDVRYYLTLLRKRKWLILSVILAVTTTTALYISSLPSIYKATAVLRLEPKESTFLEEGRGSIYYSYNNQYDFSNTQVKLLSNPQLMRQVVVNLNLEHNAAFLGAAKSPNLFSSIRQIFAGKKATPSPQASAAAGEAADNADGSPAETTARLEPYVTALLANLTVEAQENSHLVTVSVTDTNPAIALEVIDTLTKIFVASENDNQTKGSQAAAETLGRQLADIQSKIKELQDQRLDYLKTHNLPLEKGEGRNLTAERLGILSSQLLAAENERKNFEAIYQSAKVAPDLSSIPQVRDSEEIQAMRRDIHQLERKRALLIQIYTPEWPEVKKVDSEIGQLRKDIDQSAKEIVNSLKSKLDASVGRESKLREAYYREHVAANGQSQDEIAVTNLSQQIETSKQIYNTLFQRQKEIEVNSIDKSNHVSIATTPVLPTQPVGPARLRAVLAGFLISVIAGLGLALLANQFDLTLRSAEDVANHISLPTMALIPVAAGNGRSSIMQKSFFQDKESECTALTVTRDVYSPSAEAYRHLRTSLLFASPGQAPRTILVTSAHPSEGKTTIAINTAVTFAQTGAQVLILDCDLRRPQIHSHFKISNSDGLTNYLSGLQDIDSLLRTHNEYPNLKLMTSGPMPTNPSDFLGSDEMYNLLEVLKRNFAHIIIDSPPASFTDASILSTLVDGVVIVVNSKRGSRIAVKRAKQRLQEVGAHVLGVVLNYADIESDQYYSSYYPPYQKNENQEAAKEA